MKTCEIIFWISLFIVFYTYIGYGMLLYVLVRLKECFRKTVIPPLPADSRLPELTLFIAAYNEEDVIDDKMRNCLALDYPADKLHILGLRTAATTIPTSVFRAGLRPPCFISPKDKARPPL